MSGMPKYYYYKKPDGEDLVGKIITSVKMSSILGIAIGTHDAILRTVSNSALVKIVVGLRPMSYLAGIGFVFANVTYMSTRIRGKDDPFNHGIGALATTPLVKAWLRIPATHVAEIMFASSVAMMIAKGLKEETSGVEKPFYYYFQGLRNRMPNWDYWEYWTGEETPLEDYAN